MAIRKRKRRDAAIRMEEAVGNIMRASFEVSSELAPVVLERMGKMWNNTGDINRQEEYKHE